MSIRRFFFSIFESCEASPGAPAAGMSRTNRDVARVSLSSSLPASFLVPTASFSFYASITRRNGTPHGNGVLDGLHGGPHLSPTQQLKGEGKHKLTGEAFFRAVSDIPFLQLQRFYSDALPARAGVSRDVDLSVSAALTATHFSAKPTVKRR